MLAVTLVAAHDVELAVQAVLGFCAVWPQSGSSRGSRSTSGCGRAPRRPDQQDSGGVSLQRSGSSLLRAAQAHHTPPHNLPARLVWTPLPPQAELTGGGDEGT